MLDWYNITEKEGEQRIEFQPSPHRYWPTEVLCGRPLPVEQVRDKGIVLTGAGAVWMYAHGAATLSAAGAREVRVQLAGPPGDSHDLTGCECYFQHDEHNRKCALLTIHLRSSPRLAPEEVANLIRPRLIQLSALGLEELCLTGQANGEAYVQAALQAVACKVKRITCLTPVDGFVVVYDPEGRVGERPEPPEWLRKIVRPPEYAVIIGVTGDPNCGKSVFSLALNHYRARIGCPGWRLDCDGQSPTAAWYLSWLLRSSEEASEAREAIKRPWTPEMEDRIAAQLRRLRSYFAVSIADLPGGNHKAVPPQRLPNHREVIFREVDALLLLERENGPTEPAWREALHPHGFDSQIAVVLRSSNPKKAPRLEVWQEADGLWRGVVEGLDREKTPDKLADEFQGGFERLWPTLLRHGRKRLED